MQLTALLYQRTTFPVSDSMSILMNIAYVVSDLSLAFLYTTVLATVVEPSPAV